MEKSFVTSVEAFPFFLPISYDRIQSGSQDIYDIPKSQLIPDLGLSFRDY